MAFEDWTKVCSLKTTPRPGLWRDLVSGATGSQPLARDFARTDVGFTILGLRFRVFRVI